MWPFSRKTKSQTSLLDKLNIKNSKSASPSNLADELRQLNHTAGLAQQTAQQKQRQNQIEIRRQVDSEKSKREQNIRDKCREYFSSQEAIDQIIGVVRHTAKVSHHKPPYDVTDIVEQILFKKECIPFSSGADEVGIGISIAIQVWSKALNPHGLKVISNISHFSYNDQSESGSSSTVRGTRPGIGIDY